MRLVASQAGHWALGTYHPPPDDLHEHYYYTGSGRARVHASPHVPRQFPAKPLERRHASLRPWAEGPMIALHINHSTVSSPAQTINGVIDADG
jgi:hypothetical protein